MDGSAKHLFEEKTEEMQLLLYPRMEKQNLSDCESHLFRKSDNSVYFNEPNHRLFSG